jgi:hypothetical protein
MKVRKPSIDKIIEDATAERGNRADFASRKLKKSSYLLRIPEGLRTTLRLEAIKVHQDMSTYICEILMKRNKNDGKEE